MIADLKKNFLELDIKDKNIFIILCLFPISLILGNQIINIFIFLISLSFFLNFNKNRSFLKSKIFYLLLFFLTSLIINIFFSIEPLNSTPRVIKIILIIFFILEISRFLIKYINSSSNDIFKIWALIFLIITIDVIYETIVGQNVLGFSTSLNGRIASFFGEELVVGSYYHGFALFFISYLIKQNHNYYFIGSFIFLIVITSFFIGERSAFIKLFISILIFSMLVIKVHYSKKILFLTLIFTFLMIFINFNKDYKYRYFDQIKKIYSLDGISFFHNETAYGKHIEIAKKIFNRYPIFGVGIKNFRLESFNPSYQPDNTWTGGSTHPHQIHYEFLSETGLFGYLCFIIFILGSLSLSIKSYLGNKNIYQLSGILFILTSLIPLLPTGSFLTTFFSSIFWINFAVMTAFIKTKSKELS